MAWTPIATLAGSGNPAPTAIINQIIDNENALRTPQQGSYVRPLAGANYTVTTTQADIDGTNMAPTIVTTGNPMMCYLHAGKVGLSAAGQVEFYVLIDGVSQSSGTNGIAVVYLASTSEFKPVTLAIPIFNLAAGSHVFRWQWKASTGTATLYAANYIASWFRET